jgi:hypothetical protein
MIENFMLISKMQTYLGDKMPPDKVQKKKRKKWDLAKLKNNFLILTFLGLFRNQLKILDKIKKMPFLK